MSYLLVIFLLAFGAWMVVKVVRYLIADDSVAPSKHQPKVSTNKEIEIKRIYPPELSPEDIARIEGEEEASAPSLEVEEPPPRPTKPRFPVRSQAVSPRGFQVDPISQFQLSSAKEIGNGGEAVVYMSGDKAWKIFRRPDDPFYQGSEPEQIHQREIAERRLLAYPEKLNQFPPWLGSRVVGPVRLFKGGRYPVGGYEMPLIHGGVTLRKYANASWKKSNGIGQTDIGHVALDLYDTIRELHFSGMLLGDFKPDNVLVRDRKAYIVDAESADYGDHSCLTYSEGYIDPQLCDPNLDVEVKIKPYTRSSDWYAYLVMLFEALTNVHPYQGAYIPPPGKKPVVPSKRALLGISVFSKHVRVPNFVESLKHLDKSLQGAFFDLFERGMRGMPKRELIESLLPKEKVWKFNPVNHTCWKKYVCDCSKPLTVGEANLHAVPVLEGEVASAVVIDGQPKILVRMGSGLCHHNGEVVLENLDGDFNFFRLGPGVTLVGNNRANTQTDTHDGPFYLIPQDEGQALKIDEIDPSPEGTPNAVLQGPHLVWVQHGKLRRTDRKHALMALNGSVRLFSGPNFGLIVTTIRGELGSLILHNQKEAIRLISLPPIMGEVVRADATFSEKACWLFLEVKWNDVVNHFIMVVNDVGHLVALGRITKKSKWWNEGLLKVAFDTNAEGQEAKQKTEHRTEHRLAVLRGDELLVFKTSDLQIIPETSQVWAGSAEPIALLHTPEGFHVVYKVKEDTSQVLPVEVAKAEVGTEKKVEEGNATVVSPPPGSVSVEATTVNP